MDGDGDGWVGGWVAGFFNTNSNLSKAELAAVCYELELVLLLSLAKQYKKYKFRAPGWKFVNLGSQKFKFQVLRT